MYMSKTRTSDHLPAVRRVWSKTLRALVLAVFASAAAFSPISTQASTVNNAKLTQLITNSVGAVFFMTDGTRAGDPACDTMHRWVIAANTIQGQALASTVLSAYLAGRIVTVAGKGTCATWADSEDVDYVIVAPS